MKDNYAAVIDALKARAPTHPEPCDCGVCSAIALLTRYREGLELIRDDTAITFEGQQLCKIARKTISESDD